MISFEIPSLWKILFTLVLLLLCRIVVKYFVIPYFHLRKFKKIPGAHCIYRPIVGTLPDIVGDLEKYNDAAYSMKQIIRSNPDTKLVCFTLGAGVATIFTDLELIKEFLNRQLQIASKEIRTMDPDADRGIGLLFAEGARWKAQRKLISQVFHFDYMNQCYPTIKRTLREWINSNCTSHTSTVNISMKSKIYTSTVIWRIFFGEESFTQEKEEAEKLIALSMKNTNDTIARMLSPWMILFGPKFFSLGLRAADRQFARERAELDNFFKSKLEKFKANLLEDRKSGKVSERPLNLVELLIDASMKADASDKMLDKDILAQMDTFFVAGTDTTAQLITMSHYVLGSNEDVQNKLREEVKRVVGESEEIKYEHLLKMEYLNAFIKEVLRCYGPATGLFPRMITEDTEIGGIKFHRGSAINASLLGAAWNPKYFAEPEVFRPERWLEKDGKGVKEPTAYLAFSAGSRRCIGEQLALIEARTFMAEIVRRFKIEIPKEYKLRMSIGLVYEARDPVGVVYTKL